MAPVHLLSLPIEVLTQIVSLLRRDDKWSKGSWMSGIMRNWTEMNPDFCAAALTCKTLNAVTTPIMYHSPATNCHALLLRTLVERPDLASHVRALDSRGIYGGINTRHNPRFTKLDLAPIEAAARKLNLNVPPGWFTEPDDLEACQYRIDPTHLFIFDILMALVAKNLEALQYRPFTLDQYLTPDPIPPSPLTGSGLQFPHLRFIAMWECVHSCLWGFDLAERKEFLEMCPNLESLWLTGCNLVPAGISLKRLRSLRIKEASPAFGMQGLQRLLEGCSILEDFCYLSPQEYALSDYAGDFSRDGSEEDSDESEAEGEDVDEEEDAEDAEEGGEEDGAQEETQEEEQRIKDPVDLAGLSEHLGPLAKTIRHLVLELDHFMAFGQPPPDLFPELASLETLRVRINHDENRGDVAPALPGVARRLIDSLPKRVKYLGLPGDESILTAPYLLAQAATAGVFPNLQKVALDPDSGYEDMDKAKIVLASAGVKCLELSTCGRWGRELHGLPTYDFVPGKDFLRQNPNDWKDARLYD